jgi:hypothetical protein
LTSSFVLTAFSTALGRAVAVTPRDATDVTTTPASTNAVENHALRTIALPRRSRP